jgi:hypothetical protein
MSKTTFDKIRWKWALRFYEAEQAIWHTRAFQQFCRKERNQVKKELEGRLQAFAKKPESAREIYEQALLETPFEEALQEALKSAFLRTNKANDIQSRLDSRGLAPHETAIYFNRKLHLGPEGGEHHQGGEQFIELRIDLTFPKERIRAEFEPILNEWHPRVKQRPRPPRGTKIMDLDEIDLMYRAYDLVEANLSQGETKEQSVIKATQALYSKARAIRLDPPAEDKRYQQVLRWHEKVNEIIGDL